MPLKVSEGFNPRPQLSFPLALALGIESRCELMEVELTEWVSPARVKERLVREMPEGIRITSVESVGFGERAEVTGTEFSVEMGNVPDDFPARLEAFMKAESVYVKRARKAGEKNINVRDYVRHARLDGRVLSLELNITSAGSVRPEEVLEGILGGPPDALAPLEITRVGLELAPAKAP